MIKRKLARVMRGGSRHKETEEETLKLDEERLKLLTEKEKRYNHVIIENPPLTNNEKKEIQQINERRRRREDQKRSGEKRKKKIEDQERARAETTGLLTTTGVVVRSKAERVIANYLTSKNIEYEYEKEFEYMQGETILCDFYLPKYDCYVEYFGMTGHHNEQKRTEYESKTQWKIELYERWNKKLIFLYPEDVQNPNFDERFQYKLEYVNSL